MKIAIVYWSGTGNTERMAELIRDGAVDCGAGVSLKEVGSASLSDVDDCDVLVLGCSSMGDEVLEEYSFEPFIVSIENRLSGKHIALFGSYGWGDGQWMRDWDERMKNAGAVLVRESLIVNYMPEGEEAERCREFGKSLLQRSSV